MKCVRINKFLAKYAACSRREADRLIAAGRVSVRGKAASPGQSVYDGDEVRLDGLLIVPRDSEESVLIALYKPVGVVCSATHSDRAPTVFDLIDCGRRLFTIGRLDKDSEGLILLTDDGDMAFRATRSALTHEKEYVVGVDREVTGSFLGSMSGGVRIRIPDEHSPGGMRSVTTAKCLVYGIDDTSFGIILTQGMNRQIRRMCRVLGFEVVSLKRIREINITLGDLAPGEYRNITGEELELFRRKLGL